MVVNHTGGEGLRHRTNATGNTTKVVITEKGREIDQRLDKHETFVHPSRVITRQLTCFFVPGMNLVDH